MTKYFFSVNYLGKFLCSFFSTTAFLCANCFAQGTWTPVTTVAPDYNGGVMLLLSDGTVIAKTYTGGTDGIGNVWDKLKPDTTGSYINGTWTTIAPMNDTRLYFSSQVLKDGRVFVAGGEYGTGGSLGETYDPITDIWTPAQNQGLYFGDANSKILPDGTVLVGLLVGNYDQTTIFDPIANTLVSGPTCIGGHDEASWTKLADGSILFVDIGSSNSERYIPSLNQWVVDAVVPDSLYDQYDYETGAGFLLPDGRVFFLGSTGHTAFYTPSGNTTPGSWAAGPDIPSGYGTTDAAGAMMVDGKILLAASPTPKFLSDYPSPTAYFEFNYLNNTYLQIPAPGGGGLDTLSEPCYYTNMLDLPDGTVLYSDQGSNQYYIYAPSGAPLVAGMPTIGNITQITCDTFRITGTLFNGISEGAAYGDDWQMATNYPIVRLTFGSYVYYARTFNWNRTDVQTGNLADTSFFTVPVGLQVGTYSLVVTANGISSNSVLFVNTSCTAGMVENNAAQNTNLSVYPNPTDEITTLAFKTTSAEKYSIKVLDVFGRIIKEEFGNAIAGENSHSLNFSGIAKGVYTVVLQKGETVYKTKLILR